MQKWLKCRPVGVQILRRRKQQPTSSILMLEETHDYSTNGDEPVGLNSLVYSNKPQTLDHLEDNIGRVIADIRPQMLEKVIENRRPDWTKSEPALAVICQKSYL
ncbi:hypothetical protein TNCV_3932081 [Trichonephila clavipes]|nr:hypothetical protein TNCV_3932081 [Trichonephila clavipes]